MICNAFFNKHLPPPPEVERALSWKWLRFISILIGADVCKPRSKRNIRSQLCPMQAAGCGGCAGRGAAFDAAFLIFLTPYYSPSMCDIMLQCAPLCVRPGRVSLVVVAKGAP